MNIEKIKIGDIVEIINDTNVVVAEACGLISSVIGRSMCNGKDTVFVLGETSKIKVTRLKARQYGICLKHLDKGVFSFADPRSIKKILESYKDDE